GDQNESIAIIGAGSWGTAFAIMLAERYDEISLWAHEESVCASIQDRRENEAFLPGFKIPAAIRPTNDIAEAVAGKSIVAFAVPTHHMRGIAEKAAPHLFPGACLVSLSKGVENGTLLRMTELLSTISPMHGPRVAVLSGPTFAGEIAHGKPAGATVAAINPNVARRLKFALCGSRFRLYSDDDVVGIEIGGALKNVMAIAAGICDGLEFGHNAMALLISRGLAEIARLGIRLGAHPQTFAGLSGMGDLVLTCTGDLSRNRAVGIRVGRGEPISKILESMTMVAEGVLTARSARELSRREGVPMPISEQVYCVLHEGKDAREAVSELFARTLKSEKG
ncbi:MAG: NAD(P)-dependent glycerol-3-phosphate dehydrogenase, partial [Syntrophorhabdaceae bacterium]|nr:NAD(P)-dependent glycerol-3-phosphate dehydrogenase [Syntrophorhabdaceae bacterium]